MRQVSDLVSHQRTASATTIWPTIDTWLEEEPIHDELTPPLEQVKKRNCTVRAVELVFVLDFHSGHATAFRR